MHAWSKRAGRRRRWALSALVLTGVVTSGCVALGPGGAAAAPSLDTNIENYVLFAQDSLDFKGRNPTGGNILNGNVGVNHQNGRLNMCLGGAGHSVVMSKNTQTAADYVQLSDDCTLGHLFYGGPGHQLGSGNPTVESKTARVPWTNIVPDSAIANPPAPKACTTNLTVPNGSSYTITKDEVYCTVVVQRNAQLRVNTFNAVTKAQETRRIWVTNRMQVEAGALVFGATTSAFSPPRSSEVRWYVNNVGVGANDAGAKFGQGAQFYGRIQVPTGRINLGNSTHLFGKFWARYIISDWAVSVTGPSTTTTTTAPPTVPPTVPPTSPPTVPPTSPPTTPSTVPGTTTPTTFEP